MALQQCSSSTPKSRPAVRAQRLRCSELLLVCKQSTPFPNDTVGVGRRTCTTYSNRSGRNWPCRPGDSSFCAGRQCRRSRAGRCKEPRRKPDARTFGSKQRPVHHARRSCRLACGSRSRRTGCNRNASDLRLRWPWLTCKRSTRIRFKMFWRHDSRALVEVSVKYRQRFCLVCRVSLGTCNCCCIICNSSFSRFRRQRSPSLHRFIR